MFGNLTIGTWRQFRDVSLDFHPRLTILTGANGAGKTTLLHLLNRHWGWNLQYVSTPRFSKKGVRKYWAGFWQDDDWDADDTPATPQRQIGTLRYASGTVSRMTVPENVAEVFSVTFDNMEAVQGVYVPSHRPVYVHQKVEQIPTQLDARQQLFEVYVSELRNRFALNQRIQSPSHRLKQALISLATFGFGNEAVTRNQEAIDTFRGFERVLRIMLPTTLQFERLNIKVPDVILETGTGPFSFDAVSGGVAALIDISWQVYMYSLLHERFVVIIDEPEAHLHPALQQRVLPNLLAAFPTAQFIVATHNPFVIGSSPDSNVYVLNYDESRHVRSTLLDMINKAGSSNEILREVLGLSSTVPYWVEQRLRDVALRYSAEPLTEDTFQQLRAALAELGLEKFVPQTLAAVVAQRND